MIGAGALIVIDTVTSPRSMPWNSVCMSSTRVDRDTLAPDLAQRPRMVGVVAHQRRHVERRRQPRLPVIEQVAEALVGLLGRRRSPANWRIVHSRPRYIDWYTPRVNGYSPGSPISRGVRQIRLGVQRRDRLPDSVVNERRARWVSQTVRGHWTDIEGIAIVGCPTIVKETDVVTTAHRSVGVVGAGFMGTGIAEAAARGGFHVVVYEPDSAPLGAQPRSRSRRPSPRRSPRGKLAETEAAALIDRVSWSDSLDDAVRRAARRRGDRSRTPASRARCSSELDAALPDDATPRRPTRHRSRSRRSRRGPNAPSAFCGLHFFSPVPVMKLVEIVVAHRHAPADRRPRRGVRPRRSASTRSAPRTAPASSSTCCSVPYLMAGGPHARRGLRHPRGHRRRHEARRRPPDGPADAVRLHRPRRPLRGLRLALRGVQAPRVRARRR